MTWLWLILGAATVIAALGLVEAWERMQDRRDRETWERISGGRPR